MFTQDCLIPKCFVTRRVPFLPFFFLLLFGFQLARSQGPGLLHFSIAA